MKAAAGGETFGQRPVLFPNRFDFICVNISDDQRVARVKAMAQGATPRGERNVKIVRPLVWKGDSTEVEDLRLWGDLDGLERWDAVADPPFVLPIKGFGAMMPKIDAIDVF